MARLIEIDMITWLALEIFIVSLLFICYKAGNENEIWVLLACGFLLILLNQFVYYKIAIMRHLLTPPKLFKKAERLRRKPVWRRQHNLDPLTPTEKCELENYIEITERDSVPPYIHMLIGGGVGMEISELTKAQKSLLGGGNGVLLALFSTRLVFLLTALHLSVFIIHTANVILEQSYSIPVKVLLFVLFLVPSGLVTSMSTKIARDGLYAFNVEHMKVPRVINKVMRILKARQTLRTLRFIAEMKVYLKDDFRRNSPMQKNVDAQRQTATGDHMLTIHAEKEQIAVIKDIPTFQSNPRAGNTDTTRKRFSMSPPMSPLSEPGSPHRQNHPDKYEIELERREINTIFCLFDTDG